MKYRVITFGNKRTNTTYYISKGVDILKMFRAMTIRNSRYTFL